MRIWQQANIRIASEAAVAHRVERRFSSRGLMLSINKQSFTGKSRSTSKMIKSSDAGEVTDKITTRNDGKNQPKDISRRVRRKRSSWGETKKSIAAKMSLPLLFDIARSDEEQHDPMALLLLHDARSERVLTIPQSDEQYLGYGRYQDDGKYQGDGQYQGYGRHQNDGQGLDDGQLHNQGQHQDGEEEDEEYEEDEEENEHAEERRKRAFANFNIVGSLTREGDGGYRGSLVACRWEGGGVTIKADLGIRLRQVNN